MSAATKLEPGRAVVTVEPPAVPYAFRSPVAKVLQTDAARASIMAMLRPGESYDRIVVEVFHLGQKNPDILKCTPASIVNAVSRAVGTGLIIGEGVHLVPFGDKLEMVLDYKGAAELVLMSRAARYLDAQCHYAKEPFEYEQGSAPFIRHRPITDGKARGELVGAYAVAKVNRDDIKIVYMLVEEIDAIRRAKSKAWKQGPLSAIPWYAKKTVIKQIVKLLPKNRELARVMAMFEREESIEDIEAEDALAASPTLQIASPSEPESNPSTSAMSQMSQPSSIDERAPLDDASVHDDEEPLGEAKPLTGPHAFPLPFTWENVYDIKTPLGLVHSEPLDRAIGWAKNSKASGRYMEFIQAGEMVLDDRKNGDAKEPAPITEGSEAK